MSKKRIGDYIGYIIWAAAGWAVLFGIYFGILQLNNNFHTVIPNELYRSAQPDAENIKEYAQKYGIKTIINLRGENHKKEWYQEEMKASEELGLNHVDFRMSEKKMFTKERVQEITKIMQDAPKPILLHCRSGADRTGLVSAIYLSEIAKLGEEEAEEQLSPYYGHLPVMWGTTHAMDFSWESIEPFLGYGGS